MREPLYRQALRQGWQLAWQHKLLWLFGFFAAFLGQMGVLEIFTKALGAAKNFGVYPDWWLLPKLARSEWVRQPLTLSVEVWAWLFWLLLVLLGFLLLLIFISVVSQGALIKAAAQFAKKNKLLDIDIAWQAGVKHFCRLFFINLFKKIVLLVLAAIVGWWSWAILGGGAIWQIGLFLLAFILAVLVGMVVSFLAIYAAGYVVVEEYPLGKALHSSWRLFLSHWLVSLEVGLIVLFLNVAVVVVALAGFLLFFFPALLLWLVAVIFSSGALWLVGLILGALLFLFFIILLGALFTIFVTTVWTHLFMKMHHKGIVSRIIHWVT